MNAVCSDDTTEPPDGEARREVLAQELCNDAWYRLNPYEQEDWRRVADKVLAMLAAERARAVNDVVAICDRIRDQAIFGLQQYRQTLCGEADDEYCRSAARTVRALDGVATAVRRAAGAK